MKYTLKIIFGQEQVIKFYNNDPITSEEIENNTKEFSFNTIEEKNSFINGVNAALGWNSCCIPELETIRST